MAAIIACPWLGCVVQACLPRGLHEVLILFQIKDRLFLDPGEAAVPAMGAGFAGQDLATNGRIDVLDPANDLRASLEILVFDFGGNALPGSIGIATAIT